jgi:hypothetical protein
MRWDRSEGRSWMAVEVGRRRKRDGLGAMRADDGDDDDGEMMPSKSGRKYSTVAFLLDLDLASTPASYLRPVSAVRAGLSALRLIIMTICFTCCWLLLILWVQGCGRVQFQGEL